MADEHRKEPRRAVLWSGHLEFGEYVFDCQIWNVSLGGAKIRVGLPLLEGSGVVLALERFGTFAGTVVWQTDGNLGLRFDGDPEAVREVFGDAVVKLGLDQGAPAAN